MEYSDYDSDGYSSNEDADYVPSDDNLSEDDLNDCEKEDPLNEDDEVPHPGNSSKKKSKKKDISVRKRKKAVLLLENEEKKGGGETEEERPPQEEEKNTGGKEDANEERQKKKSDDLWASFLSDVGTRPKPSSDASQPSSTQKQTDSPSALTPVRSAKTQPEPEKVVITKVFDFAGEQVKVEKEVSADSREAKSYLKSQGSDPEEEVKQPTAPGPSSVKRPAGMSSILGQFGGKKPKMSTLEKSKMDWDAFKSEEGIGEELAIHNRGREGYVERKNFLERVDHRQFELEKSVRLNNMKR